MAVAYQTGVATKSAGNVATLTSASMTVSGSNTYLLALVVSGAGSPVDPVSCKWGGSGGTAMTKVGTTLTFGTYWKATLYELVNPTAGAGTLYVDYGANQDETGVIGVLYTGVNQTTPRGTVGTGNNNNSHPMSATCTTVAGDTVVGAIFIGTNISGFADSQTVRQNWAEIASGYELASVGDKVASGTSTTVNWNTTYDAPWGAFAIPLNDATAGGTTYTLTADSGSFSLIGASANTLFNRVLSAGSGSFTLTGEDASRDMSMAAESAAFALTGSDVTLTYNTVTGGSVSGQTLTATGSILAGTVIAGALVSSQTLSATVSLITGSASGETTVTVSGQTLTATGSVLAGTITVGASIAAQTLSATASLIAGAASGGALVASQVVSATASLIAGSVSAIKNATVSGATLIASASLLAGNAFIAGTGKLYRKLVSSVVEPIIQPLLYKITDHD